ncbi:uncharacterized protein LOC129786886 [Lutzomyia longipalpis]|uniref:uncharacterized protein LOC129786886 n=1 Tax=Lutzomyia longipalpis TaxID=7200 RepID=UPI0024845D6F|nr:uncharacterized protein LOC129786886 [Lutzomyia longipalpis]
MKMESEGRSSTASTVSGVYQNILKSPAPICMFYFSHPFGIISPVGATSGKSSTTPKGCELVNGRKKKGARKFGEGDQVRKTPLIPWPRDTWRREISLPPLIQLIARRNGRKVPDIEGVLSTIRRAWNTPSEGRGSICSGFRDETSSASDWDLGTVSSDFPCCQHRNRTMGSGTFAVTTNGGGLLRRRYSVPEIIMRKHSLSQQQSLEAKEEPIVASTAPTPRHSPLMRSPAEMGPGRRGGGSDSNLSRATIPVSSDMRKSTLLRRFWGRDTRRGVLTDSRSGSWSPPPRRSHRRLHFDVHQCVECQKLNGTQSGSSSSSSQSSVFLASGRTPSLASPKRLKLMASPATDSRMESEIAETSSPMARDSPTTTAVSSSSPPAGKNVKIYMTSLETPTSQENNNPSEESLRIEIETTTLTSSTGDENMNGAPTTTTVTRTERVNRHQSDEEMDRYISKLLIDSLNNVIETSNANELIRTEDTNGNEAATPRESTADENLNTVEDGEVVYSAISTADISDPALDVSDTRTSSTTPPPAHADVAPSQVQESKEIPIYFPRYSAESKGDLSSYTSVCSEPEVQEMAAVGTGSSYPDVEVNGEPVLVPRLSAFPRTESMEVQPSSASACEDAENGDALPDDEDSVSLVDSLDDPESPDHKYRSTESLRAPTSADTDGKSPHFREKGEAFFVPMSENQIPVDENIVVADTMPEKLRDKLVRRQKRRDMKKELELRRRQKMQKYIDQKLEERLEELQANADRNSRAIIAKKDIPVPAASGNGKGSKKSVLRTEIGMLESYTIDSRGNMQFNPPPKETKETTTKAPKAPKRTNITRKFTKAKSEEHPVPEKKVPMKKSASDTLPRRSKGVRKDVQHMTLYQTADLTPDIEGGPRRMYQKTEIQDGEKRIEILEIVECLDSSPETSPGMRNPLTYRISGKSVRRSRIPVPIYKSARKSPLSETSSPRAVANTKVDKLIADLLIEALNNPVDLGIEFVASPKIEKAVNGKRNGVKKRSANSGIKYHQVFDVIPEERSSFSFDSSNEESGTHKTRVDSGHGPSTRTTTKETMQSSGIITKAPSVEDNSKNNSEKSSPGEKVVVEAKRESEKSQTNRGRAALESDTWLGFFKPHEESSAEGMLVVQESSRTHHHFCPHHPCHHHFMLTPSSDTLTTVSSFMHNPSVSLSTVDFYSPDTSSCTNTHLPLDPTAPDAGTFGTSSSGSENILTVIEKVDSGTSSMPQPHDSISDHREKVPTEVATKTPREAPQIQEAPAATEVIDSNSFVIIPTVELPPVEVAKEPPEPETARSTQPSVRTRDVCKDCCFCNPDLHKKTSPEDTSRSCHFCDKKRRVSAKKADEEPQSGYETAKSHHYYEILSKSDHQHTQTKSKDPETISTRCVKTNERIQRFVPSPEDSKKGKINRPRDIPEPIARGSAVHRVIHDEVDPPRKAQSQKKPPADEKRQKIKFPSPYRILSSPQSYDDGGSSGSEDIDFSPPAPRMNPPMRSRWANSSRFASHRKAPNSRSNAKSSFASATSTTATPGTNTGNFFTPRKGLRVGWHPPWGLLWGEMMRKKSHKSTLFTTHIGWSVTVAGNYHPQLAPDVEMRLSFPKSQTEAILPQAPPSTATTSRDFYEMTPPPPGATDTRAHRPALPPTGAHTLNPKRTLTKVTPAPSANGRNYRFPEVSTATSQAVSRQTAKKAIKRVECSVAVTSATRTISKFSRQRAMSFQSLHPAIEDSYRNRSRDGSIGNLSSRRMSLDGSQSDDVASLSIMGNAIAPETKPRVPTMSEKDLTRRHSSCFTRNRSYLT